MAAAIRTDSNVSVLIAENNMKKVYVIHGEQADLLQVSASLEAARQSWMISYSNTEIKIEFAPANEFGFTVVLGDGERIGSISEQNLYEQGEHL